MTSTLLQQAVEALKLADGILERRGEYVQQISVALVTLQAALRESALQQQPEPVAPAGYELVMVPNRQPADEPDWEACIRQAEVATGLKVERHTLSIVIREVRRWLAGRNAPPALQQQEEPREVAGWKLVPVEPTEGMKAKCLAGMAPGADAFWWDEVFLPSYRALLAASPSPQDFTLPMVEEGKGVVELTLGERKYLLSNPQAIALLMVYHDLQQDQADSMEAGCHGDQLRHDELKAHGKAIVEQDPDIWGTDVLWAFGLDRAPAVNRREEALRRAGAAGLDPDPDVVGDGVKEVPCG